MDNSPRGNKESFSDIVVLVDIDDTIVGLCDAWCKYLKDAHGTATTIDDITEWDISKFFPTLTREQVFAPLQRTDFWNHVKPKKNAIEYVKKLIDDGFNVYLCTSTDYRNVRPKYECVIQKYFPFIKWQKVIVSCDKAMIKADFLVDDGVHNLEGGGYIKILISAPHNNQYNAEKNGIIRVTDMKEAYCKIHEYAQKMVKQK